MFGLFKSAKNKEIELANGALQSLQEVSYNIDRGARVVSSETTMYVVRGVGNRFIELANIAIDNSISKQTNSVDKEYIISEARKLYDDGDRHTGVGFEAMIESGGRYIAASFLCMLSCDHKETEEHRHRFQSTVDLLFAHDIHNLRMRLE